MYLLECINSLPNGLFVLETQKVANITILECPSWLLLMLWLNYKNGMMRLVFRIMALELNIFNSQRQPLGFNDIEAFMLNWIRGSIFMLRLIICLLLIVYEPFSIDVSLNMMCLSLMTCALILNAWLLLLLNLILLHHVLNWTSNCLT